MIDRIAEELQLRHGRAQSAQKHWCARTATGASVIRVFAKGTKPALLQRLVSLPIEEMRDLRKREEFEQWFEAQLQDLAAILQAKNRRNRRVQPGLKWGHGAKVLSIYIRSLILHGRFFSDEVVTRVRPWLFVPVDGFLIKKLKECGVQPPFGKIKDIATKKDFYFAQNLLAERCGPGISRIVFDDSWADRAAD